MMSESHRVYYSPCFPKAHEKAVKIILCLIRWLSQHQELIDRVLPKLHMPCAGPGLLFTLTTVSDSQGMEDTNAKCPTSFSKLAERLWHGLVDGLPLWSDFRCHKRQTTDGFVCCVSQ